jgi:opacity protein-like surface antigen
LARLRQFIASTPEVGAVCGKAACFGQGGKTPGTGGVSFAYNIPLGNQFVIGLEGNVSGGKVTGSSTQSNVHSTFPADSAGSMTSETFQGTLSEGTNATVRVRFGVPIANYTALIYGAAGVAVGKVGGSYNYSGSNFPTGCPAFSGGGGIELMTGIPGITIDLAYKYTTFGSFSEDVPLIVTNCPAAVGNCSNGTDHIDLRHVSFQSVTAGLNYHTNQNTAPGPAEQGLLVLAVAAGAVAAGTLSSPVPPDRGSAPVTINSPLPCTAEEGCPTFVLPEASQSFTGGFFIGYNRRFGKNWILGAEADFAWKRLNASPNGAFFNSDDFANAFQTQVVAFQVGQKWDASIRARFGAFITPSIMTYVTGGVAFGNVNGSYSYSAVANGCTNSGPPCTPAELLNGSVTLTTTGADSWSFTRVGWTAGTGLEAPVGGGWKMRLEYRFTDLGSFQRTVPLTHTCSQANNPFFNPCTVPPNPGNTTVPAANVAPVTQEASFQTIRVGLAYSFNGFDGFDLGGFLGYSGGS